MKYNKGDKYIILEGEDENLAVEVLAVEVYKQDDFSSITYMACPIAPIGISLINNPDEYIINKIKKYAYNVGLIGLSSIRVLFVNSNEIIIGNKYNLQANKQFSLDTYARNNELLFDKENGDTNLEKGSIYLLEKLRTGLYVDYMPSFHRQIGKTTVLLENANQLANEGKKVLYLSRSASSSKHIKNRYLDNFENPDDVVFKGINEAVELSDSSTIIYDEITMKDYSIILDNNNGLKKVREKYGYLLG